MRTKQRLCVQVLVSVNAVVVDQQNQYDAHAKVCESKKRHYISIININNMNRVKNIFNLFRSTGVD